MAKGSKKKSRTKKEQKSQKKDIDVSKHILVPQHVKLSEEEVKELLEKYKIKKTQLPRIKRNDPAIKNLDVKPGDVIKIIRKSPTAGEYVYYRVVVD